MQCTLEPHIYRKERSDVLCVRLTTVAILEWLVLCCTYHRALTSIRWLYEFMHEIIVQCGGATQRPFCAAQYTCQ